MATNAALNDLAEIETQRPDLTQDEWEIVSKATDWLKATLRPEVRAELEVAYDDKLKGFQEELQEQTKRSVDEAMEDWRKSQEPLGKEDYNTLLSQEYLEFKVLLPWKDEKKHFTIVELPAAQEKKFLKNARENLVPFIEKVNAAEWSLDGSLAEQINSILEAAPDGIDIAAMLVAICLNPKDEIEGIDTNWVLANLSTWRISKIIEAQSEANRYRDFFSKGSRTFLSLAGR